MIDPDPFGEGRPAAAARRQRSLLIAGARVGLGVLIFVVSVVRLTANAHLHG